MLLNKLAQFQVQFVKTAIVALAFAGLDGGQRSLMFVAEPNVSQRLLVDIAKGVRTASMMKVVAETSIAVGRDHNAQR